jgi:hypothetical protein
VTATSIGKDLVCTEQESKTDKFPPASDGLQAITNTLTRQILCLKTRAQLKQYINNIAAIPPENVPDIYTARMVSYAAGLLKPLEGIAWRLRPIVELHSELIYLNVLDFLRTVKYNDYNYGSHLKSLFAYLTDPPDELNISRFSSFGDFQANFRKVYLMAEAGRPARLDSVLQELIKIGEKPLAYFDFSIDKHLVLGKGDDAVRFLRETDMVKHFIAPYHYDVLYVLERTLGYIYYVTSVNVDAIPAISAEVLTQSLINNPTAPGRTDINEVQLENAGGLASLPASITPDTVYSAAMRHGEFLTSLLPLKEFNAQLDTAFKHFSNAAKHELWAYVCGIKIPLGKAVTNIDAANCGTIDFGSEAIDMQRVARGRDYLLDPNQLLIDVDRNVMDYQQRVQIFSLEAMNKIQPILSQITGKKLNLNAYALFHFKGDENQKVDLKPFFFPKTFHRIKNVANAKTWQWDHQFGKPLEWYSPSFNGFVTLEGGREPSGAEFYKVVLPTFRYTPSMAAFANLFVTAP